MLLYKFCVQLSMQAIEIILLKYFIQLVSVSCFDTTSESKIKYSIKKEVLSNNSHSKFKFLFVNPISDNEKPSSVVPFNYTMLIHFKPTFRIKTDLQLSDCTLP